MTNYKFITKTTARRLLRNKETSKDPYNKWIASIIAKIKSKQYAIKRHTTALGPMPNIVEVWKKEI